MTKKRICVKCGDELEYQNRWHMSTKQQYAGNGPQSPGSWYFRCYGPNETAGGRDHRVPKTLPMHHRDVGAYRHTTCGLRPGRVAGKHKDPGAQVTWQRVRSELRYITCAECLAVLAATFIDRLKDECDAQGVQPTEALSRAKTRLTMNSLEKVVG